MVFQSYALYPHMTVFANIAYPLAVRRQPKAEVEAAVKDVARQVQPTCCSIAIPGSSRAASVSAWRSLAQ